MSEPRAVQTEHISAIRPSLLDIVGVRFAGLDHGCRTGFYDLDEMLGALRPGSINLLTGPPAIGKTTLALGIAANAAAAGTTVLIASNKLPTSEVAQRLLAITGRIDGVKLREGRLNEDDWATIGTAVADMERTQLHIADHVSTIEQLASTVDDLPAADTTRLVIIDRIDPLTAPDLPATIGTIRALAHERSIAFVATTSASGASRRSEPRQDELLADLVDAAIALGPSSTSTETLTLIDAHVVRNRYGPTGTAQLIRQTPIPTFLNHSAQAPAHHDALVPD